MQLIVDCNKSNLIMRTQIINMGKPYLPNFLKRLSLRVIFFYSLAGGTPLNFSINGLVLIIVHFIKH